tara:strand:- start:684 stop:1568 length:885 start_codon:yes stop_codon:yes gene_type:complete
MVNHGNHNKIILGTVQMGLDYGINNKNGKIPFEESEKILNKSYLSGINTLDTAEVYGDAHSVIGRFHENNPSIKFNINTKIPNYINLNQLELKIENYLDELRVDHLETVMFHSFDSYLKNKEILTRLISLKNNGIIKNIGVSVYENAEIENLLIDDSISVVQLPFNLLDNLNLKESLFERLKEKNKLIHTRSAFLQGLFFKDLHDKNRIVQQLKAELGWLKNLLLEYNCSIEQLAISYCFMNKEIDNIILGIDSLDQLNINLQAAKFNLTNELLEKIHEIKISDVNILNPSLWN